MKRALVLCSLLALAGCLQPVAPAPPPPPPPPAANVYRGGGVVTVQVTGYADRSGSARYNQRLSVLRARHVAHALARMGVPWRAMAISGRGENDNAVPTPDGVREPRNRRVTVVEG